jgi:hypothetical protein
VRTPARPKVVAHAVQVKGKPKAGRTVTVDVHRSAWSSGTRFTYQWRVNGKVVGTSYRLTLRSSWVGKRLTVRVTGKRGDWTPTTVSSKAVRVTR